MSHTYPRIRLQTEPLSDLGRQLLLFFLAFFISIVPAQGQEAFMHGHVVDENGVPVDGAEILLLTSTGIKKTAYSNAAGNFELSALAPAIYHATVVKPGFFLLKDQEIDLKTGSNEISFSLSHEYEVHQAIDVVSPSQQVDPQQTDQQQTLEAHQILDIPLPRTHDLQTYLPSVPGIMHDNFGALHVGGARDQQAQYLLDGFEIGDPATGQLTARLAVDTVRSIAVYTGAYGAQYPHGGAAVLSLKTYLGDDNWRFGTTNFIPSISLKQGANLGNWYPRFTLSGPIQKGRAWFSDAISLQRTFTIVSDLPKTGNTTTQWSGDNWLRLQYNLTSTQILQGNFLVNQRGESNLGLGVLSPASTTTDLRSTRYFYSVKDQIAFRQGLFEFGAAFDTGYSHTLPQGRLPYVLAPDAASGNFFEDRRQHARRWQSNAELLLPSRHWHGSHDVRTGFNLDNTAIRQRTARSAIETVDLNHVPLLHTTFSGPSQYHLSSMQTGGYVQDSWQPLRKLVIQAGGRADWNDIIGKTLWAPRLAANVLPFSGNQAKLTIAWGMYYQQPNLSVFALGREQQRNDLFVGLSGLPVPVASRFLIHAGLKQPYFKTASVGWEQKIGAATFLDVRGTIRKERNGLAYEFTPATPQGLGGDFLLQNNRRDEYRSIEASLRRSFRSAEIFADYTRSRARSNEALDYALANPVSFLALPLFAPQLPGALLWDAPNRLLSYGWTPIPFWSLLLSYDLEYRTGFPYNVVTPYRQLLGAPDQFRFPALFSLNVGVEKRFHFHGHEWAARMAVLNLTDHHNPDSVNNIAGGPRIFAGGQDRAFTARIRLVGKTGTGGSPLPTSRPGSEPAPQAH